MATGAVDTTIEPAGTAEATTTRKSRAVWRSRGPERRRLQGKRRNRARFMGNEAVVRLLHAITKIRPLFPARKARERVGPCPIIAALGHQLLTPRFGCRALPFRASKPCEPPEYIVSRLTALCFSPSYLMLSSCLVLRLVRYIFNVLGSVRLRRLGPWVIRNKCGEPARIHDGPILFSFVPGGNGVSALRPFLKTKLQLQDSHFSLASFLGSLRSFLCYFCIFSPSLSLSFCTFMECLSFSCPLGRPAGCRSTGEIPPLKYSAASRWPPTSPHP